MHLCIKKVINSHSLKNFLPVLLLTYFFIQTVAPLYAKPSPTLVLESANSNEMSYSNGEFVSVLKGNVTFNYDDMKIRSNEATWRKNIGVVTFRENVRVSRGDKILTCDRLHFTKDGNLLTASGNFRYSDPEQKTVLTGREGEYRFANKHFTLKGDPKLIRYDTSSAETLTITGITMSYTDSLKMATVHDNVKIHKGKLLSLCKRADYFTETNISHLRVNPSILYDSHEVTGDSIDLFFGKESLDGASVSGNGHGIYSETTKKGDSLYTHIWGDSLYMSVSDSGDLDSLFAFGKVTSKYFSKDDPENANEARGKTMVLAFNAEGEADNLLIQGNARSIYFVDENGGKGRNEASGDRIKVYFTEGKARKLILAGSARGTYIPILAQK